MQAKREKQQFKEHRDAAVQARKELKTVCGLLWTVAAWLLMGSSASACPPPSHAESWPQPV